jgi:hypothetical protein
MDWRGDVEVTIAPGDRLERADVDFVVGLFDDPIGRFPTDIVRVSVEGVKDSEPGVLADFEKRVGERVRKLGKTPSFDIY